MINLLLLRVTEWFKTWEWWELALLVIGIFLITLGITGVIKGRFNRKTVVEFHENREALIKRYGSFVTEFAKCKEVWVCTWIGQSIYKDVMASEVRITRLVVSHPEYSELKKYATMDSKDVSAYQNIIVDLTRQALKKNIPVYWINEPTLGTVIANPEIHDGSGWARIEGYLPFGMFASSPSYTIREKEMKSFFYAIVKSFNTTIENNRGNLVTQQKLDEIEARLKAERYNKTTKITEFFFEPTGNTLTTKTGLVVINITFRGDPDVTVDKLFLEIDGDRVVTLKGMMPLKVFPQYTDIWQFDLSNKIRGKTYIGKLIALVKQKEYESRQFDVHA